jgi:hypothetical protein
MGNRSRASALEQSRLCLHGGVKPELWAIRMDGKGVVSDTHIAWKYKKQVPMVASRLVIGDRLYMVSDAGSPVATSLEAGPQRDLERASGADRSLLRVAAVCRDDASIFHDQGKTVVIKPGRRWRFSPLTNWTLAAWLRLPLVANPCSADQDASLPD